MATLKEMLAENNEALNWLKSAPESPGKSPVMDVLGIDNEDLTALKWVDQNPNHEKAQEVKNIVYQKMADKLPVIQEQGVSAKERFTVKNLLDTAGPEIQQKYLQDKGYATRVKNDQLQVRKADQGIWSVVDPNEIDIQDLLDHVGDVIEIGAGIPATLGGGFAGGAAVGAGFEAGKQALGKALGVRESVSPFEVGVQGALGGLGAKAGQLIGKGAEKAYSSTLKYLADAVPAKNVEAVTKAAKALGIDKLFPTQKVESKLVERLTSEQIDTGLLGGYKARSLMRQASTAVENEAKSLVSEAASKTPYEFGDQITKQVEEAVAKKLAPAKELYSQLETNLKFIPVKKQELQSVISDLQNEFKLSGTSGELRNIAKDLSTIRSLDDLKAVRTSIGGRKSIVTSPETAKLYDTAYQKLTDVRSNVLKDNYPNQKAAIEKADSIYKQTATEIENLFGLKAIKGSVTGAVGKQLENLPKEKVLDKIFKTGDLDQLKGLQTNFPTIFEDARKFKLSQIADKATYQGELTPTRLVKEIDKLTPEVSNLLFGAEGSAKAKNLKIYLDSLPKNMNLSGTTHQKLTLDVLNPLSQAASVGRSILLGLIESNALKPAGAISGVTKGLIGGGILGKQTINKERNK